MQDGSRNLAECLTVLIRDDDICYATPVWAMEYLRESVWADRAVSLSAVPYGRPSDITSSLSVFAGSEARYVWDNQALENYLSRMYQADAIGLAMHGWTHLSKKGERTVHEFSIADERLLQQVLKGFEWFDWMVGYRVFVPPHNEIHTEAEKYLLAQNINLCRSLRDSEVQALSLQMGENVSRADAKRMLNVMPRRLPFTIFQTLILNKRKLAVAKVKAVDLSATLIAASALHGFCVVTLHWWDFFNADGKADLDFVSFVSEFFRSVEERVTVRYIHFGDLAKSVNQKIC